MAKLNDARRSLLRAKESEQSRLTQLDSERREIRASLKSLDAALRILGESKQAGPGKKPTATTTEVTDLIIEILSDVGTRSTDQLIELVAERLDRIGIKSPVELGVHMPRDRHQKGSVKETGKRVSHSFAFQVFHDQEMDSILLADVVQGADVRMVQAGDGSGFALESFTQLGLFS